jgi:hypothetical protein
MNPSKLDSPAPTSVKIQKALKRTVLSRERSRYHLGVGEMRDFKTISPLVYGNWTMVS